MTRTLPSGMTTALSGIQVTLYYAVEMFFDSGTLRVWTGWGDLSLNGNTFIGTGSLLSIEGLDEVSDLGAKNATVNLSGVDSSLVSIALQEPYQGRNCKIYLGANTITTAPAVFSGQMDVMTIADGGETSTISVSVESRLAKLDRPNVFRYTSADQKNRYAGDTFFDYVVKLADKSIYWGREQKEGKGGINIPTKGPSK